MPTLLNLSEVNRDESQNLKPFFTSEKLHKKGARFILIGKEDEDNRRRGELQLNNTGYE